MKKERFLFLASILTLSLTACGGAGDSKESVEPEPEKDNRVSVYIMSGQSNMEGSTYFDNGSKWLEKAYETLELDGVENCFEGFENIYTSYYGYYPYESPVKMHASNVDDPMAGLFEHTQVGEGNRDDFMGPEIGMAQKLQEYATEDNPIFFIKCAFSGSGFSSNGVNWTTRNDTDDLYYKLKTFTHNNLDLIEDMGYQPVVKGFLWHQGESDTGASNVYGEKMRTLVDDVRSEFVEYAEDEEKENIAFIDACIYDGPSSPYGNGAQTLNKVKMGIAEDSDSNFCINTSFNIEGGLKLEIGLKNGDVEGGCDIYHYKTKDMVMLGEAYADVIIENEFYVGA